MEKKTGHPYKRQIVPISLEVDAFSLSLSMHKTPELYPLILTPRQSTFSDDANHVTRHISVIL